MAVLDADAHVEEWAETFDDRYLDPAFQKRRPQVVGAGHRAYWLIDDQIFPRLVGRGCHIIGTPTGYGTVPTEYTAAKGEDIDSMELRSVEARIQQNVREGIDLQVVYPTLFLAYPLTSDPALAAALCRSYNNWIHDICGQRPDKLKWVAVVSLDDVPSAVAELRRCRQVLDAVGVIVLGTVGEKNLDHPSLAPFWQTAAELECPVAVHVGWPCVPLSNLYDRLYDSIVIPFALPTLMAFNAVLSGGILDRHPTLRVGFFELGSQWVPFLIDRMSHYYDFVAERAPAARPAARRPPLEYLQSGQVYITCEVDDRLLPQVVTLIGEDQIFFASDIPHGDREPDAVKTLEGRTDLTEAAKRKILYDNAARFYSLS
jgi:predicted TIM-barrel fold metal-dependent hydrolase